MEQEPDKPIRPMGAGLVAAVDWSRRFMQAPLDAAVAGLEVVREVSNSAGAAPLHAAFRLGLKELQDNFGVMSSGQSRDEPGSIANPTPQLVTEQMNGNEVDLKTDRIAAPEVTAAASNDAPPRTADADNRKALLGNAPTPQTPANEQAQERGRRR